MSDKATMRRVSRPDRKPGPCVICKHTDGCMIARDGSVALCLRVSQGSFGEAKGGMGWYHRLIEKPRPVYTTTARPRPNRQTHRNGAATPSADAGGRVSWKAVDERLRAAMTPERSAALASATGVPAAAWAELSPGWADPAALAELRAGGAGWQDSPVDGAWSFAERDGDGRIVGIAFRATDGRKGFAAGGNRGLTVPANLPKLPDPVLVVEGASDVAACVALGLAAVGRPNNRGGAEAAAIMLDGRKVLVVGERDGKPDGAWPGRDGAKGVAGQLAEQWEEPVAWSLPPVAVKDIRAWLQGKIATGLDPRDGKAMRAGGAELLTHLHAGTETETPMDGSEIVVEPWPTPDPLPADLPPVKPFAPTILPAPFVPWISDIAARMQCPPDYPAVAAMVGAGALIGRKVGIRPKRRDDWTEVPNLWGIVVGRPGVLKTPAMQEPQKPLNRLEIEAASEHAQAAEEYEAAKILAAERRKVGGERVRKALKDGGDAASIAAGIVGEEAAAPVRRRYLVNDSTVEKLGVILNENPNGVLMFRDELSAFLRTMDREGHEGDRGFYLEAWNGKGRFTYDRIGRGTLDIEAAIVSILGGIQPGPLQEYLRGAVACGQGDDGLVQRFQLAVWPDVSPDWRNVDEWPDTRCRDAAHEVFQRLATLTADSVNAEHDRFDPDAIRFLRFNDEAQPIFDAWRERLEKQIRAGTEHPAIEAHLSKYRKLIPAIALIIHLAEGSVGSVSASALARAISWGEYLETHARRIYAGVTQAAHLSARALAARIRAGEVKDGFAVRDVYRNGWSMLASRDDALAAADVLLSLNWLREEIVETGGRDKTRYRINPRVSKQPQNSDILGDATAKTDKSPRVPPSVGFVGLLPQVSQVSTADDRYFGNGDPEREKGEI